MGGRVLPGAGALDPLGTTPIAVLTIRAPFDTSGHVACELAKFASER